LESSKWHALETESKLSNIPLLFFTLTTFGPQKEIEVLMNEIFVPMLEMRTSTLKQKAVLLQMLSRLSQDAQALVDLYINYDCDSEALDNLYERSVI
jgi:Sec7-like guanine-nucleotide exchange factor